MHDHQKILEKIVPEKRRKEFDRLTSIGSQFIKSMRRAVSPVGNLFGRLISYTPRIGASGKPRTALEDFTTEILAWCLQNSFQFRRKLLSLVRQKLSKHGTCKHFPEKFSRKLEVTTQVTFGSKQDFDDAQDDSLVRGRFDLVMRSDEDDFVLVVENKVDDDLGETQVPRYQSELETGHSFPDYHTKILVTLTKRRDIAEKDRNILDAVLFWSEVHSILEKVAEKQPEVCFVLKQFSDFLQSRGMFFMKIPETQRIKSLKDGVEFFDAIRQILTQAAKGIEEIRGNVVRMKGDQGELWFAIGSNNGIQLGFQIKPTYRLMVATPCDGIRQKPAQLSFQVEEFNPWPRGFEFYGKWTAKMNGNADEIRMWFEDAAKEALKIRDRK